MTAMWAIGLMSGTSLDGIDAALLKSDGETISAFGPSLTIPYEPRFREILRGILGKKERPLEVEKELTLLHASAVQQLKERAGECHPIKIIGFHGQTLFHDPADHFTLQIGDGPLLAQLSGIDVVNDFRSADIRSGGQGAPLVPIYHAALAATLQRPIAILNIGGVANVTGIGEGDELLAFDTGPGNALMDDWIYHHTGRIWDENGLVAAKGIIDDKVLAAYLSHPFFDRPAPKSLDRNAWGLPSGLSLENGMATLAAFTVAAIDMAQDWFPTPVNQWLVCGGGRHNRHLMHLLEDHLGASVNPVEKVGWQGDYLEAQAFAFLAIRSLRGLPLSFPGTTGVKEPVSGGVFHSAVNAI